MAELSPLDDARRLNTPPLQGRGRGWRLTAGRIDSLNGRAHAMRREPTEPEVRLWRSQLGGHRFGRQAVIGSHIADFLCPLKAIIVEVDGDTRDLNSDRRRDAALHEKRFTVLHVTNDDVMRALDGVRETIPAALAQASDRWESPHPDPSPEEEGLE